MKSRVRYLTDTIIVSSLAKYGQEQGFLSGIVDKVKDYVKNLWDPNHPVESVLAFITPAILTSLGFTWIGVLYEVAEALGFNWINFFDEVRVGIKNLLTPDVVSGKEKMDTSKVGDIVGDAFDKHYTGETDTFKLMSLIPKLPGLSSLNSEKQNTKLIVKLAQKALANGMVKNAAPWGKLYPMIKDFFIRIISWVINTGLVSLGFAAGGALLSGTVGEVKEKVMGPSSESESSKETSYDAQIPSSIVNLKQRDNLDSHYTDYHPNDVSNIWMERNMSADNIDELLKTWAVEIYPDLEKYKDQLEQSSNFQKIVSLFKKRNQNTGLSNVLIFPRPFERIIDIVNTFAGDLSSKINKKPLI